MLGWIGVFGWIGEEAAVWCWWLPLLLFVALRFFKPTNDGRGKQQQQEEAAEGGGGEEQEEGAEEEEMEEEEWGNTDQNWGAGNACDRYAATGEQEETCPRQNASKR